MNRQQPVARRDSSILCLHYHTMRQFASRVACYWIKASRQNFGNLGLEKERQEEGFQEKEEPVPPLAGSLVISP